MEMNLLPSNFASPPELVPQNETTAAIASPACDVRHAARQFANGPRRHNKKSPQVKKVLG